jgi:hypothetical protein
MSWWKSPRPEIGESELFVYPDEGYTVIEENTLPENITASALYKGIPQVSVGSYSSAGSTEEYDEAFVTSVVKSWVSKS